MGLGYAATVVLFVHANRLTTSANAIFLQCTAPLWLVLLAPLGFGERLRARDLVVVGWLAVGLSFFFIGREAPRVTAPAPALGNLLALSSGLAYAFCLLGLRHLASPRPGARSGPGAPAAVTAGNLLAALLCLPFMAPLVLPATRDVFTVLYLGIVQLGLGYWLVTRSLRSVTALEGSVLLLLEPALNPWWTWWLLGERPGGFAVAGGLVLLSAIAAKALLDREARERSPHPDPA